MMLNNY